MRFMMQYDPGYGDYTQERRQIVANPTSDTFLDAIDRQNSGDPQAAAQPSDFLSEKSLAL